MLKIAVKIFCLATFVLGFTFSQAKSSGDLVANFNELLSSSKELLGQLSLEVEAYEQWFKDYQSQILLTNGGILEEDLNQQLEGIWGEIERLERKTKTGWLDSLSGQLDSLITTEVSANEISSWIFSQELYIEKIQEDVIALGRNIENIKQTYPSGFPNYVTDNAVISAVSDKDLEEIVSDNGIEELSLNVLESAYTLEKADEYDALEASLLFLLSGLEIWGQWLEPTNEIGLLPEAEGRFMTSSTPILQASSTSIPGGLGVVGFAQPIIISHGVIPKGFTEEISEPLAIDYNDSIEDVFQKVPYHDRLVYQYGVEINGRSVQIYRKPIETELTLSTALQRMGAPPDVAELWVEEYAEIAFLPHTIQLSWLIAGNPLAKDYKLHAENLLNTFDLNALFLSQEFSPQASKVNVNWVNEDPFWEELQNQPFLKAFTDLLSGTSEKIQRSFIVSLFFLEPSLPVVQGKVRTKSQSNTANGVNVRSKPFFWEDGNTPNPTPTPTTPEGSADPAQEPLVKRALQQKTNLIHYWTPRQGDKIIPWAERNLLSYDKGNPYFIIAVTALPQLEPFPRQDDISNYPLIVQEVINYYLPKNQPVFKVFLGTKKIDRKIVTAKGIQLAFTDTSFVWSADTLDNDTIMQHAKNYYESHRISPYAAIKLYDGPYLAGSLTQLKRIVQGKQNYQVEEIVLKSKGVSSYKRRKLRGQTLTDLRADETWLQYATRISAGIFGWLPQQQDELLVQSEFRKVVFTKKSDLTSEIKTPAMVKWSALPTNETLLQERTNWYSNIFLMQVKEGYFLITSDELEHLQTYADETPQVHSLILSAATDFGQDNINLLVRSILGTRNLNCDSVRVLAARGIDIAYTPKCKVVVTNSGQELAQADAQTMLANALENNQPVAVFRSADKPASAVPLRVLVDVDTNYLEGLAVSTLVPVYDLEGLEEEEKEFAIELSMADALKRTLQFFPQQSTFEILLPKNSVAGGGQKFSYTSNLPEDFEAIYSFDEIETSVPNENKAITFYRVGGAVDIRLSESDVYMPSGEINRERVLELAQKFHKKNVTPYAAIKSNKGNYYGGSLRNLSTGLPIQEYPKSLLLMVTRVKGINNQGFGKRDAEYGWLQLASENVIEYAEKLNTDLYDTIGVLSTSGQRYAAFTPFGELLIKPTIQWTERPSNQILQSLRKVWEGHLVLVNVPDEGYFLAHSSDGKFLKSVPEAKIDTIVLATDSKEFSRILTQAKSPISTLGLTDSVRVLSASGTEGVQSTYSGLDLALRIDGKGEPVVDLKHSGLELSENPEQWLNYAEIKSSPLVIFRWDGGPRSSALLIHLHSAMQDLSTVRVQQLVPAYSTEDLESAVDSEEKEDIIATSVQDTLQRASNFLPNQNFHQVVMPSNQIRYYSQKPPTEHQIQPEPLGIIEVTRQYDNTKIKYYYHPEGNKAITQSNNTDVTQTLALLAKETGFENTQ